MADEPFNLNSYSDVAETPEYSPKSELSKPLQVSEALKKCVDRRGEEMVRGYFNTTITKTGEPIRIWVKDGRKVFIGCVTALKLLLTPEIKRDEGYQEFEKKIMEKIKKLYEDYSYPEGQGVPKKDGQGYEWKSTGRRYIPEIDSVINLREIGTDRSIPTKGGWNFQTHRYWDELLILYDEIFGELNNIIDKLNYFKAAISF